MIFIDIPIYSIILCDAHHKSGPENRDKLTAYVRAVTNGELSSLEVKVTDLVSTGCLRADQIARTLVPSLLAKADRMRRGCQRTGSGQVFDEAGLQELGFLLGQRALV